MTWKYSDGRVGIKQHDPEYDLDVTGTGRFTEGIIVQGDITAQNFIVSSSVTYMTQSFSSGSTIFGDSSDDTHQFTGSINTTGYVGIMTSDRQAPLHVENGTNGHAIIRLEDARSGDDSITAGGRLDFHTNHISANKTLGQIIYEQEGPNHQQVRFQIKGTLAGVGGKKLVLNDDNGRWRFYNNYTEDLALEIKNQKLGVGGVTNPSEAIHVSGSILVEPDNSDLTDNSALGLYIKGTNGGIKIGRHSGNDGAYTHLYTDIASTDFLYVKNNGAHTGGIATDRIGASEVNPLNNFIHFDEYNKKFYGYNYYGSSAPYETHDANGISITLKADDTFKVSGSLIQFTPTSAVEVIGNISGSSTSTGSFGSLVVADKVQGDLEIKGNLFINDGGLDLDSNQKITGQKTVNGFEYTFLKMYDGGDASVQLGSKHPLGYISFQVGNGAYTERMRIKNNGDIAIFNSHLSGSASSTGSFGRVEAEHIHSTDDITADGSLDVLGSIIRRNSAGSNNGLAILSTDSNHGILALRNSGGSYKTQIHSGGNSYVQGGNFGIGTPSPTALLHLEAGSDNADGGIRFTNDDTGGSTATDGTALFIEQNTTDFFIRNYENAGIRLRTNDTDALYISNSQFVGIGTTNPTNLLELSASDSGDALLDIHNAHATNGYGMRVSAGDDNNVYSVRFQDVSFNPLMTVWGGGDVEFHVANAKISGSATSTGSFGSAHIADKVGIGTESPDQALLQIDGSTAGEVAGIAIRNNNNTQDNLASLYFGTYSASVTAKISAKNRKDVETAGSELVFFTRGTAGSMTEKMVIEPDGNVGIGTDSPATKLDVKGEISASGDITIMHTDGDPALFVRNSSSSQNAKIHIGEQNTTAYGVTLRYEGNLGNFFIDNHYDHSTRPHMYFRMRTAGTPITAMTIDPDGQIGIGETSPDELLHIKSSTDAKPVIKLENSGNNVNSPQLVFLNSSTANDNDITGTIRFKIMNDAGTPEEIEYGTIYGRAIDVSDGTEDGELHFRTRSSGNLDTRMIIQSSYVGIGTTSPEQLLHLKSEAPFLAFTDSSNNSESGILYRNTSGTNVGFSLYDFGNNAFKIRTNNSLALTIDSAQDATFTGHIALAATKGIFFDGGSHTSIAESSGDNLRFQVGASNVLDITTTKISGSSTSTGSFGILSLNNGGAQIAGGYTLNVKGHITGSSLSVGDGVTLRGGVFSIYKGANVNQIRHDNNNELEFRNANTAHKQLTIADTKVSGSSISTGSFGAGYIDNKLGIGTTAPDHPFHINSNVSNGQLVKLHNTNNGDGTFIKFTGANSTSEDWQLGGGVTGFSIYSLTDSAFRFIVGNDGNVGIGALSAPTHTLHALSTDNKSFLLDRNQGNNPAISVGK